MHEWQSYLTCVRKMNHTPVHNLSETKSKSKSNILVGSCKNQIKFWICISRLS